MKPINYRLACQSGMTLIEVLVSLLIFSFAFLGLISMQARAVRVSTDAEDRNRAALMANEIVTTMWTQQTMILLPTTITEWQDRLADPSVSGLPESCGTISDPDAAGVVTVTVSWHASTCPDTSGQANRYVTQVIIPSQPVTIP